MTARVPARGERAARASLFVQAAAFRGYMYKKCCGVCVRVSFFLKKKIPGGKKMSKWIFEGWVTTKKKKNRRGVICKYNEKPSQKITFSKKKQTKNQTHQKKKTRQTWARPRSKRKSGRALS
jgi:hypothetical protein